MEKPIRNLLFIVITKLRNCLRDLPGKLVSNNKIMTIKFVVLNVSGVTPVRERLLFLGKQTWKIDIECTSGRLTQIMGDAINSIIRFFYGRLRQITRHICANI